MNDWKWKYNSRRRNTNREFYIHLSWFDHHRLSVEDGESKKVLTLAPLDEDEIPPHNSVFINELKLSDFKQVLMRNNISSELSGGVLICANGTCAVRRVSEWMLLYLWNNCFEYAYWLCFSYLYRTHRLTLAKWLSKDAYPKCTTKYAIYSTNNTQSFRAVDIKNPFRYNTTVD